MLIVMRLPPSYIDGPYTPTERHDRLPRWMAALKPGARLLLATIVLSVIGGLSIAVLAQLP